MTGRTIAVQMSVHADSTEGAIRAHEAMTRISVGLALEGLMVNVAVMTLDDDDDGAD